MSERTLGAALVALRKRKGWSQAETARRAGLNRSDLNRYELGKVYPGSATLMQVLEALGLDLVGLLFDQAEERRVGGQAEDGDLSDGELQEIIATAQKRAELLRELAREADEVARKIESEVEGDRGALPAR